MLKDTIIEMLQAVEGNSEVQTWDLDDEEWAPVTGFTHGGGHPIRLYTDED